MGNKIISESNDKVQIISEIQEILSEDFFSSVADTLNYDVQQHFDCKYCHSPSQVKTRDLISASHQNLLSQRKGRPLSEERQAHLALQRL